MKAKFRIGRSENTWVAVAVGGSAVLGAGVSMYGANKQDKANAAALQANKEATEEQNRLQWAQYLMSRGINPTGSVEPGQMPTSGSPMNTRLPLWASVRRTTDGASPRLVVSMPASALPNSTPGVNRSFSDLGINR